MANEKKAPTRTETPGYIRGEDGTLRINPKSLASVYSGKRLHDWSVMELVNVGPAPVKLPHMEKREFPSKDGSVESRYVETGEQLVVLPLQAVMYHAHVMNHPGSPFVPRETPESSEYTATPAQVINYFTSSIPDIAFDDAMRGYVKWSGEKRGEVMTYFAKRKMEVEENKQASRTIGYRRRPVR